MNHEPEVGPWRGWIKAILLATGFMLAMLYLASLGLP
jgi:hypothetical protein